MDFRNLFGEMESLQTSKKEEKKAEKKKEKKSTGSAKKNTAANKAKGVKLTYPVTIMGRGFRYTVNGEGEVNLQEVIETAYKAGYVELKMQQLRFAKLSEHDVYVDYTYAAKSAGDTRVNMPVTVCFGMKQSIWEASAFEKDPEDICVEDIANKMLSDEMYDGLSLCYDATSDVCLVVPEYTNKKPEDMDWVIAYGECQEIPFAGSFAVEDYLGECPKEKPEVMYAKSGESGTYFITYKVVGAADSVDRSFAGVKEDVKPEKVEEKILLPVNVLFINLAIEIPVTSEDMQGKGKVTKDELLEYLKAKFVMLQSKERKIDTYYDTEHQKFSIATFSGTKGAFENPVFSICGSEFCYKLAKIPAVILEDVLFYFRRDLDKEAIVQIWYDEEGGYRIQYPEMEQSSRAICRYHFPLNADTKGYLVATIHSHNTMPAFFSSVDDRDELSMPGIYGVVGNLSSCTTAYSMKLRGVGFGEVANVLPWQMMEVV